ncbi:MAG: hypothetical protein ABIJ12_00505 [bacterium]
MKRIILLISLGILIFNIASADEKSCPADRAAELGNDPFGTFHEVMAPVWHVAWPDSNFEALFEAGPAFKEKFKAIAKLEPTFKNEKRKSEFIELRKNFAALVDEYAQAAEEKNKEKVYEIMPRLHDAFEFTASALLPVHYPQIEGIVITVNMILENHLPKNNIEGITGSTETLISKLKGYDSEALPDELKEYKVDIEQSYKDMLALAMLMEKCCKESDMESYKKHITDLDKSLKQFIEKYI